MKLFAPSKPLTGPLSPGDRVEIDPEEPWEIEEGEVVALLVTVAARDGHSSKDGEVVLGRVEIAREKTVRYDEYESATWTDYVFVVQ